MQETIVSDKVIKYMLEGGITEYKCRYSNSVGVCDEVTEGLGLEFPDAYMHSGTMQILANAIKKHDEANFVLLPFCRTVEAEAMGAVLNYGDSNTGPRAKDPICANLDDLLALPEIDFNGTFKPENSDEEIPLRIHEVLDAIRSMKAEGETVCLEVTGPFTMLNALMESRLVFKAYRKERNKMKLVFDKLGEQLLRYIEEAMKAGTDIILFSDSAGALDILGPKFLTNAVEDFYAPFVRKVGDLMDENCIFLLCPKFAYALVDTGYAEFREHQLEEGVDFLDAMLRMRGTARIGGQVCFKSVGVKLSHGRFREIVLK